MAKTILSGHYAKAGTAVTLHTAAGRLLGFLISHAQATVQTVSFYDDTSAVPGNQCLVIHIDPTESPVYIHFPRDAGITFDTGLHLVPGNCDLLVWSVDHG